MRYCSGCVLHKGSFHRVNETSDLALTLLAQLCALVPGCCLLGGETTYSKSEQRCCKAGGPQGTGHVHRERTGARPQDEFI